MKNSASFQYTVDRFIEQASPSSMDALISQVRTNSLLDSDIAYLAQSCANADGLIWSKMNDSADVASTGGPASLTTLLCPLFLRAFGFKVPKLGVPGRPAGGIDVLAQIPGFRVNMTKREAADILRSTGYVHFMAGNQLATHDAILFAYRKKVSAVNLPPLVIASLLAKKLIVGLTRVGLDIRVSSLGNFGETWRDAKVNAKRFCSVSNTLGISSVCFLTDGSIPYQPYIGRGESLVALAEIFDGTPSPDLEEHLQLCYAIARSTCRVEIERPTIAQLWDQFAANLRSQGADPQRFLATAAAILENHRFIVLASQSGFLSIDLEIIRRVLVTSQNLLTSETVRFPDPIGLILKGVQGSYFDKGAIIATARAPAKLWLKIESELGQAFNFHPEHVPRKPFEEVAIA